MGEKLDITVLTGVSSGDVFHFAPDPGKSVTIGRNPDRDIVLQDPTVSRLHASIELRDDGFFIIDHGSAHGTVHMGFQVVPGAEGARRLSAGDEFKIGEHLFKVSFDSKKFVVNQPLFDGKGTTQTIAAVPQTKVASERSGPQLLRSRKVRLLAGVTVALLLVWAMLPEPKKGRPPQKSEEVLTIPEFRVLGNWAPPGAKKDAKDQTHIDKVQLSLPASDVLIEYDFRSETPVDVLIDGIAVETLQPVAGWQIRHLIIRGLALGTERRLVFDNLDFPRKGEGGGPLKSWAVRDVRATPLSATGVTSVSFDSLLTAAIGLVEGTDKSPEGLFLLVRALESAIVGLLQEMKIDAVGYAVDLGTESTIRVNEVTDIKSRLDVLQRERTAPDGAAKTEAHLKELTFITSQLDAELWRRVNSRMAQARISAKVKDYIVSHDELVAAQKMFPGEQDYRWTLVYRLFKDEKVVPKRVRQNPGKFRKD